MGGRSASAGAGSYLDMLENIREMVGSRETRYLTNFMVSEETAEKLQRSQQLPPRFSLGLRTDSDGPSMLPTLEPQTHTVTVRVNDAASELAIGDVVTAVIISEEHHSPVVMRVTKRVRDLPGDSVPLSDGRSNTTLISIKYDFDFFYVKMYGVSLELQDIPNNRQKNVSYEELCVGLFCSGGLTYSDISRSVLCCIDADRRN